MATCASTEVTLIVQKIYSCALFEILLLDGIEMKSILMFNLMKLVVAQQGVPPLEDLKMAYYHTLIRYHLHFNNYLEICRSYKAMYESEEVSSNPDKWKPVSSYFMMPAMYIISS